MSSQSGSRNPEPEFITGLDRLQATWGPYLDGVFPQSTVASITEHLAREAAELVFIQGIIPADGSASLALAKWAVARYGRAETIGTASRDPEEVRKEIGDVLALSLHLSHQWGVSFHRALTDTLEKVRIRTEEGGWGEPDGAGVVEHTGKVQGPPVTVETEAEATRRAVALIAQEREAQVAKGWTRIHDDGHTLADFIELIADRADRAYSVGDARLRLVQIAALAQACVEKMIRQDMRAATGEVAGGAVSG
jgi:NTP pyrophosphatase (non-canonical NTP hydrolase)